MAGDTILPIIAVVTPICSYRVIERTAGHGEGVCAVMQAYFKEENDNDQ
jgi:hypothetical protein